MARRDAAVGWLADLEHARRMAADAGRPDLAERLALARRRLTSEDLRVVVVGEFKRGKSTLVNALLRTDVCPVDVDVVTAVPTQVRHGAPPSARAHPAGPDGAAAGPLPLPFARLRECVTGGELDGRPLRAVEVRVDRRLLRGGLSFVDTPGVGGLDSAQGNATLAELTVAHAALFVTDASQELTAPELEFLVRAAQRCPRIACVLTKVDLHAQWRRIRDIDEGHLTRAGLRIPIVPVSSFLRMRAAQRARGDGGGAALNAESGFPALLDAVRALLDGAEGGAAAAARRDLALAVAQLREQVGAERAVARRPEASAEVTGALAERVARRRELADGSASWQTVLVDGLQDLQTEVEHDLRERMRGVLRRGEAMVDGGDPYDTWPDFTAWAAREATAAAADNLFLLVTRTERLAGAVAERFELAYAGLDLELPAPAVAIATVGVPEIRFERSTVQQFLGAFTAARVTYGGLITLGAFGSLLGLTLAAPVGVLGGLTVARTLVRAERRRQVEQRRGQAKQELRRYLDEVLFVIGKQSYDAVRSTQRYLRDEFAALAGLGGRSAAQALDGARRTAGLPAPERDRRAAELDGRWADLDRLSGRLSDRQARGGDRGRLADR